MATHVPRLSRREGAAAALVWLYVLLPTVPLLLPFLLQPGPARATRSGQVVAVVLMFALGMRVSSWRGTRPAVGGWLLAGFGMATMILCVALGG